MCLTSLLKATTVFFFEGFSPLMNENFVGPPTEGEFWEQYETAGDGGWWTDFDWGGVIGGLGGVINIFSNWGDDVSDDDGATIIVDTPAPTDTKPTFEENAMKYGPWVLVAFLIGWLAYRGKL